MADPTFDALPGGALFRMNLVVPVEASGTVPAHWIARVISPVLAGQANLNLDIAWLANDGSPFSPQRFVGVGVPLAGLTGRVDVLVDSLSKTVWVNGKNTGYRHVRDGSQFFRIDNRGGEVHIGVTPVGNNTMPDLGNTDVSFCYRAAYL